MHKPSCYLISEGSIFGFFLPSRLCTRVSSLSACCVERPHSNFIFGKARRAPELIGYWRAENRLLAVAARSPKRQSESETVTECPQESFERTGSQNKGPDLQTRLLCEFVGEQTGFDREIVGAFDVAAL
jgi:hypothetical protein